MMNCFERAKNFIYRNARPIDLARWQYHFENGSRENVLNALAFYQNEDGGFGHALEPDCWNPHSSPIQTWYAASILRQIGMEDGAHPLIQGMLRYLGSGGDFADGQWRNTVPTNNDYPHAIWWEYREGEPSDYNPTASLAGFLLQFAPRDSELYALGEKLAREAVNWYLSRESMTEPHVLRCFIELFEYCRRGDIDDIFDMAAFESRLKSDVSAAICHDTDKWATEYVCKPSQLFSAKDSIFYADNVDAAEYECDFILHSQLEDGSYPVTWLWHNDCKEFEVAANWWRSEFIIRNFLYFSSMRGFGRL